MTKAFPPRAAPMLAASRAAINLESRRRPWRALLALLIALGLPAARGVAADPRALLPDDVRQKGTLVAAMPLDFEPFNYLDETGRQTGLDVEIFTGVAEQLGLKPEIQRLGFASIIPSIKGGRVDVGMSGMGMLPVRLAAVSFVRYGRLSSGLVVRKGNPTNLTTTDGCGRTLAFERGTLSFIVWTEIQKTCEANGKPINFMILEGRGAQLLAVETGRAEAAGFGYASALIASKHSNGKLEPAPGGPVPGGTVECGIAFAKERPQLGEAIAAALQALVDNGRYDRIFATWNLSADRAAPEVRQ
jgi:polar amino acid transport system substrate-binding protein